METLGSLVDKLCIATIRHSKMAEANHELTSKVWEQCQNLQKEIDGYLSSALTGEVPLEEPKFKIYKNENPAADKFDGLGSMALRLFEANLTLWGLEDKRRSKTISNQEKLAACDEVAIFNRVRNDAMDSINSFLSQKIKNGAATSNS